MKVCRICGAEKELSEFHKRKKMKDGHINECKECIKKYNKIYSKANKDKKKEYNKRYYKGYDKDRYKGYNKEYYDKNSLKFSNRMKYYFDSNKHMCNDTIHKLFNCDSNSVTYIIKSNGFYKIGHTTNLYLRLNNLKSSIDICNIYLLDKNIEKRLHKELSKHRFTHDTVFKGYTECFNLPIDVCNFILDRDDFKEFVI